ncbi:hypothetical protein [Pantoea agglomerans]|uniref:hypothetical protein n=1 Tax=Enterobacter agglomerans TaxID=549 RepID=UPI001CBABE89|nr:hypothetical protein [Pantoea agglomerans]
MSIGREDLLLKMYEVLNNEISRHITVIWQSISVVVGAFTLLSLVEKNIMNIDVAISIILLLITWLFDHLIDSGYWYNRNLVMIANIERQFLTVEDQKEIHYYFGSHRSKNKMLTHLKIQRNLGVGLAFIVIGYHFFTRVYSGFPLPLTLNNIDPMRMLPYLVIVWSAFYIPRQIWVTNKKYKEFIENSPGKTIDTSSVTYGVGHPTK